MEKKKTSLIFRFIKGCAGLIYPGMEFVGLEKLPDEPCVIVANHSQIHGPAAAELCFPDNVYTWCTGEMMELKEVPDYAYRDFWSEKPPAVRWLYRIASYLIAPLSVCVFNNARTVPVYRDARLRNTFRISMERLEAGESLLIFPEHNVKRDHILYQFQDKFIDLARLYYKKSGKALSFVPCYIAPRLRKIYFGRPVRYVPDVEIKEERARICTFLMDEIRDMACALPEHIVVPYENLPKRLYKTNLAHLSENINEKTCC